MDEDEYLSDPPNAQNLYRIGMHLITFYHLISHTFHTICFHSDASLPQKSPMSHPNVLKRLVKTPGTGSNRENYVLEHGSPSSKDLLTSIGTPHDSKYALSDSELNFNCRGCVTSRQIGNIKSTKPESDVETLLATIPGFKGLTKDSKDIVLQAFIAGEVQNKTVRSGSGLFKALGFKVEHALSSRAVCRSPPCKRAGVKMAKGELRFGWLEDYDGQHATWKFKHW
jgi:hypothetical protein